MMIADNRRRYERIIVLLTIACLLTTPVMAQPASDKAPKSSKPADKAVAKKTVIASKKTGGGDAPELTAKASQAIDKGLKYLISSQNKNGSWDGDGEGYRAVGITSLALMAFMSKAQFPGSGPYAKPLDRAKDWLLKYAKARPDGYLGTTMYEHGLATLALSEMWGMTRDKKDDDAIQKALEKAVEVILRSQNPGGGWRYQPQADGGEDTSCTQTVFHALASARQAGIMVSNETIAKVVKYFKFAHNAETGGFTYSPNGRLKVTPACTAGGAYCAQLAGQRDSEMVAAALRYLRKLSPQIFNGGGHYYYAHYYAIQAMVQAGDKHYAKWYPHIRDALISRQQTNGAWHKGNKGTAYETPMAIIILATPHRYIPIYQR
ncbi:MAG: terpene cyclase/mutase family protein [Planctomycetes bacterium]|nr:terpene cyclase/mutase family protein [Planctomycetota bacterium]